MTLTVLSVAYPFAPVGPDSVGGAEQVLTLLDYALTRMGHRSIVVACEGSQTAGTLIPTPRADGLLTDEIRHQIQTCHRTTIERALGEYPVDLVHMHGIDFIDYLPPRGTPVLATLHLPPDWYAPEVFEMTRPQTYLHCVSETQRRVCPAGDKLLPSIGNGVPVDSLKTNVSKRNLAVSIGRICPEKGFHHALESCKRAGISWILAGEVFRYEAHEHYFQAEVLPRLDKARKFLGPAGFEQKRRLLTAARCLLAPSLVAETSSLVAMEALACGTPVIAFPSGALAEIVEHGRTGFLVNNEQEMAEAIIESRSINPEICRDVARERFSAELMVRRYLETYSLCVGNGNGIGEDSPIECGN